MISRLTEGFTQDQLRIARVRTLMLLLKLCTDFLATAGTAFTASAIEAKGVPTLMVLIVCIVGGIVVASKNLGDAVSAALPPPILKS
jgi:hypothetical protein